MKITGVKQYYYDRYHFIKLETDEGIWGFGEATLRVKQPAIAVCIDMLTERLIGQDVFCQEWFFNKYFGFDRWRGGVLINTAITVLEMAILDIFGKKYGVPVYTLLGGKVRDEVPIYASGWNSGVDMNDDAAVKQRVKDLKAWGFNSIKSDPMPWAPFDSPYRNYPDKKVVDKGIENVYKWREYVGDDVDICVDLHGRLDYDLALRFMHGVEGANLFFVEEPLNTDDEPGYIKLKQNTNVPLAAGERWFTRYGHRMWNDDCLFRVAQPDFDHCAGLFEAKKLSENYGLHGTLIAPHNSNNFVSTMAALHVDATLPNLYKQEFMVSMLYDENKVSRIPIKVENGCISFKDALPGLGLDPDFELLEQQKEPLSNRQDW